MEEAVLTPSNGTLIDLCRVGDQRAWSALVTRYERLVYSIPLREGLDEEAAADITQATFEALHSSLEDLRSPEYLSQWLVTVCRRATWRRAAAEPTCSIDLVEDQIDPTPDFSDDYLAAAELFDAVQSLGEPCRSLIVGLFFDPTEPDYASIAVRLGRPVGSIGPLRGRCLAQLRRLLQTEALDAC